MRLAYISDTSFYEEDGKYYCHEMDYDMIERFLRHFDHITILGRKWDKTRDVVCVDFPNVDIITYGKFTSVSGFIKNYKPIKKQAERIVKDSDAVYCRHFNGIIAQKLANKYKKPCVVYVGGSIYDSMRSMGKLKMTLAANFAERAYKKSVRKCDAVLYCAPHMAKQYPTNGDGYDWVDIILEDNCPQDLREKRFKTDLSGKDEIKIGLIGQFYNNVKGVDTAIEALSLLEERYRLFILGDGERQKWIDLAEKYGVSDRLIFSGYLSGSESVFKWLDTMDIYIQPSRTEGLGKAPLEAMSRGIPVITSGQGAMGYNTNKSLIHSVQDYKTLAEMIKKLAEDKDFYREMSQYSFKTAKNYTTDHFEEVFDVMCKKLIGRK